MDYEKENMFGNADNQHQNNHDNFANSEFNASQRKDGMDAGRSQRPRIRTQKAYSSNHYQKKNDEGFRPEGFGAGLQRNQNQQQRGFKPHSNYRQNNYKQKNNYRQSYNPHNQMGYGEPEFRPQNGPFQGFNNHQQGGQNAYRPRPAYGQQGMNQSYGYGNNGYQQRPAYGQRPGKYQQGAPAGQRNNYRQNRPGYNPNAKYSMKKRIEYKEVNIDPNEPMRLNKFLANAGVCSRREADEFIQAGVVKVNGEIVTELGTKIMRTDTVVFHDQPVTLEKKVYVLLNKPKDYVTTSDDPQQRKTVMDLVKDACPERIYPVGRLDRNTTGVLLLTNDGELASKLTHPKFLKKKVYHVYLDKSLTAHDMHQIAEGITLDDGEIHADAIEYASPTDKSQVGIEIHSGKNRIVRRIFESLGYRVVKLDRVLFAGLTKKNVRRGDWRFLTEKEVDMLRMGAFE